MTPSQPIASTEGRSYEILEALGERGDGGRVFRGRLTGSAGFAKIVAIKLLDDTSRRGEPAQRLRDEARLLALLRHRAIVNVDDLVELDGRWAVVMEFVDGRDLSRLMLQGPVPGRTLAEIGVELASALAEAHEARDPASGAPLNLVHRDVQPGNVRITPQGQVMLLGFGLARAKFAGREAKTGFLSVGSAGYLAPERLVGVDSAAGDVYGLGATLASAALGEPLKPWSPTTSAHGTGVDDLQGRLARALGGSAGEAFAARVTSMLAYNAEARPSARRVENELLDLVATLEGPWLRRWAGERIQPYAPPPPAPAVPVVDEGPGTAGLVAEQLEIERRAAPPRPAPTDWSPRAEPKAEPKAEPRAERRPTTNPPRPASTTPAPTTQPPPANRQRIVLIALAGGFAVALLFGVVVLGVLFFVLNR